MPPNRSAALAVAGLAAGALVASGAAPASATAQAPPAPLEIRVSGTVVNLAGLTPRRPLLRDAVRRFGPPSERRPVGGALGCHVRWSDIGLRVVFADFGGGSACDPDLGRAQAAAASGRRWRTGRGLAVGDTLADLRRLYPRARRRDGVWGLVRALSPISGRRYTVLGARVGSGGRVRALEVHIGAAGD